MSIQAIKQRWAQARNIDEPTPTIDWNSNNSEERLGLQMLEDNDRSDMVDRFKEDMSKQMLDMSRSNEIPEMLPEQNQQYGISSGLSGSYFDKMSNVESGGSYTAENPNSGAYGRYQILKSTATPMLKKYGATWSDFKKSPALQDKLAQEFTANNARMLSKAGFNPTDRNLYMAHQMGIGNALKMLRGKAPNQSHLRANGVGSTQEWMKKFGSKFA